jgi:hypothetical protein
MKIVKVAHHRNGVTGNSFHVVLFYHVEEHKSQRMVAIVFEEPGNCAVLNTALLCDTACVGFGENSYRGDTFEAELRAAIQDWEATR